MPPPLHTVRSSIAFGFESKGVSWLTKEHNPAQGILDLWAHEGESLCFFLRVPKMQLKKKSEKSLLHGNPLPCYCEGSSTVLSILTPIQQSTSAHAFLQILVHVNAIMFHGHQIVILIFNKDIAWRINKVFLQTANNLLSAPCKQTDFSVWLCWTTIFQHKYSRGHCTSHDKDSRAHSWMYQV